jgi:fluoride exporter
MPLSGFFAVGIGAVLGAWLRWWLAGTLNASLPNLPLGTLAANLVGGYLVGLVIGSLETVQAVHPQLRLFLVTGFLGALTTFSTFSAEAVELLQHGRYGWAFAHSASHLLGSLALTFLGFQTATVVR